MRRAELSLKVTLLPQKKGKQCVYVCVSLGRWAEKGHLRSKVSRSDIQSPASHPPSAETLDPTDL